MQSSTQTLQKTESDEEDERYDEVQLKVEKQRKENLKGYDTYGKLKCIFCLQRVRFQKDGVMKAYPLLTDDQVIELEDKVSKSKLNGTFRSTGAMQIADWFNTTIISESNEIRRRACIIPFENIGANDIIEHFRNHIDTEEVQLEKKVSMIDSVCTEIFEDVALVIEKKRKKSAMTGNKKKKLKREDLKLWDSLNKTHISAIRALNEMRMSKTGVHKQQQKTQK